MPNDHDRPLSALALNTYLACPLRYRYRYLDGLYWSRIWNLSPENRAAIARGDNFHLMARRFYSDLEPARIADPVEQRDLDAWMNDLQHFLPRTWDRTFHPELELRLNRPGLRLQATFDLLVVEPDGKATIYDWKTHRPGRSTAGRRGRPLPRRPEDEMQLRVYRFMLCAAGGAYSPRGAFRPEDVAMVFWNPLAPGQWERLTYSADQCRADDEYLTALAAEIAAKPREAFAGTLDHAVCSRCEYRVICHDARPEPPAADDAPAADDDFAWVDLLEDAPPE